MSDRFHIEEASWRDFTELRQLEIECFPVDAWPFWDILGVLAFPGIIRLKAVVDGKMAGFIAGEIRKAEGTGWIATLAVTNSQRRGGIATALISACEIQMDVRHVKLCVRRSNAAAIALYLKLGYQEAGIWKEYYIGGEDALVLEKELEKV